MRRQSPLSPFRGLSSVGICSRFSQEPSLPTRLLLFLLGGSVTVHLLDSSKDGSIVQEDCWRGGNDNLIDVRIWRYNRCSYSRAQQQNYNAENVEPNMHGEERMTESLAGPER